MAKRENEMQWTVETGSGQKVLCLTHNQVSNVVRAMIGDGVRIDTIVVVKREVKVLQSIVDSTVTFL